MKYIVNKILELVSNNEPEKNSETMIMINGFNSLKIYQQIAQSISEKYRSSELTYKIVLAGKKWLELSSVCDDTTVKNAMLQNKWVAESESITYYRNLHLSNILILMGVEDEDDTGGLKNCFTITPEKMLGDINGNYSSVFDSCFSFVLEDKDRDLINKIYNNLFEFVAPDICHLSDLAERWNSKFDSIEDEYGFVAEFFKSLPEWGLPGRTLKLPKKKQIEKKGNFLRSEYHFISGKVFNKISDSQYKKLEDKLEKYGSEDNNYNNSWNGWNTQGLKDYNEFCEILKAYARGESIQENRKKLLSVDFSIVEDIVNIKLDDGPKIEKDKKLTVSGEPLKAFLSALIETLKQAKNLKVDCFEQVAFEFTQAEVVTGYTESGDSEIQEQLRCIWENICVHTNGIFSFIDRDDWLFNGNYFSILCKNENFFNPVSVNENINGIVKTAFNTNTLSKVSFIVTLLDASGKTVKYYEKSKNRDEDFELEFCWAFNNESSWLYNFEDIVKQNFVRCDGCSVIPIGVLRKLKNFLVVKSEEEFFDNYDEANIEYNLNLIDFINKRISNLKFDSPLHKLALIFEELGKEFCSFTKDLLLKGFYNSGDKRDSYIKKYNDLASKLLEISYAQNQLWLLDVFIYAFTIGENISFLEDDEEAECCIVPPWHPSTLQKLWDQKIYILDGIVDAWNNYDISKTNNFNVSEKLASLYRTTEIQSSLDLFPAPDGVYFGILGNYGAFSVYGNSNKTSEIKTRVKDLIKKEAIYDEEFNKGDLTIMNDDAKMIYDILRDYIKALPEAKFSLSLVFINPRELQPIIAAVYSYVEELRSQYENQVINIKISILVKPENKGGRNYLAYWMDDYFSHESNIIIHTYLNEWNTQNELDRLISSNNDIIFNMDLMHVNTFNYVQHKEFASQSVNECRFPVVYKPVPLSRTSKKRLIELSQPQFSASFNHTQIVFYRRNPNNITSSKTKYIAVRESSLDKDTFNLISLLHEKAYWVVCIDKVMDGALLNTDPKYSIIGFCTGKGIYGQYNLTITAKKLIQETVKERLNKRLAQLFHWQQAVAEKVIDRVFTEAAKLDGISLLSAVNQNNTKANDFMAYVLTSLREKNDTSDLHIIIHLDSYKHWFVNEDDSCSRPDFLILSVLPGEENLKIKAKVVECKISSIYNASKHIEKAKFQVSHGLEQLKKIFDPESKSLERRYWFAQLYRALAFAQITFSDNTKEYSELTDKLRSILDGNFTVEWSGEILGYWFDMAEKEEVVEHLEDNIEIHNIPQQKILEILTDVVDSPYISLQEKDISLDDEEESSFVGKSMALLQKEMLEINTKDKQTGVIYSEELEPETMIDSKESNIFSFSSDASEVVSDNLQVSSKTASQVKEVGTTSDISKQVTLNDIKILLGADRASNNIYWEFGNPKLTNRHLLITGTSGQGKTYCIQKLLSELSKSNISAVVIDYTEGFAINQLEKEFVEIMNSKLDNRIVYLSGVPLNPFKINEIEIAGIKAKEKISDISLRVANILTHVNNFGEQQFGAIFDACQSGLKKYGDKMNMKYLEDELRLSENKSAKTVVSKMSPFFETVEFTGEEFDWKDVLYNSEGKILIFQLTKYVRDFQVIITEFLLWDMWHFTKMNGSKDKPFAVVLDEAQNLSHKENSPSGMILTEGRKFGWSAWYATQSLKTLSDDEIIRLMQSAFKLYFRPTDEEISTMAKWLNSTDVNEWKLPLTNLKKGQCVVVGSRTLNGGSFGVGRPIITNIEQFKKSN